MERKMFARDFVEGKKTNEIWRLFCIGEASNGKREDPGKVEVLTVGDWEGGGPKLTENKKVDGNGLGENN